MKRYAISVLLERLDPDNPERIMLHRAQFKADHDFHAIDVATDLDLITTRCRKSFARSLYEWFTAKEEHPDNSDNPDDS